MLRALILSLLILCTVAATLPLAGSFAGGRRSVAARRQHRRHRRHSRAWWRRHRRLLRQRRAAAIARHRARLQAAATQPRLPAARAINPAQSAAEAHALLTPKLAPLALPSFAAQTAPNMPVLAVKDTVASSPVQPVAGAPAAPRRAVTAPNWPGAWHSAQSGAGELRFNVRGADGR